MPSCAIVTITRIIFIFALTVALQTGVAMADPIRIGTEGSYPPFNFVDSVGKLHGFDIELTQALCSRMGAECEMVTQDFEGIVPALVAGKFDAVIASLWITDERKQRVDFTKPYYLAPALRDAQRDGGGGRRRRTGGAQGQDARRPVGHRPWELPAGRLQGLGHQAYWHQEEADAALAAGKLDAAGRQHGAAALAVAKSGGRCCEFVGPPLKDPKWFGEGVAIAVRKGDTALRARFDKAIDGVVADGTYKAINDKYFRFPLN